MRRYFFPAIAILLFYFIIQAAVNPQPGENVRLVVQRIGETEDIIESKIDLLDNTTNTLNNLVSADQCNPTLIQQSDFGMSGDTAVTLSTPGVYLFAEDITFNPASATPAITVDSANVTLNMKCFRLIQGNATAGIDGIQVASGNTDVMIKGKKGSIESFTHAGITVQDNCDRISISGIQCIGCGSRGVEFLGSGSPTAPDITEVTINNIDVIASCTSSGSVNHALLMQGCLDATVKKCNFNQNGISSEDLSAVQVANCQACNFSFMNINQNTANDNFTGIELTDQTKNCTFRHCTIAQNEAQGSEPVLQGIELISTQTVEKNEFNNCIVTENKASDVVDGFLVSTGNNNNIFKQCEAIANEATGSSTEAIVHGFRFLNNNRNVCLNCIAQHNQAPNSTASPFGAFGFKLDTTTNCNLIQCLALDQSTGGSSSSIGFDTNDGTTNELRGCESWRQDTGFRLVPSSSTDHIVIQNVAGDNTTNFSGFPAGSIQTAATILLINGTLTNPWTNVGINN